MKKNKWKYKEKKVRIIDGVFSGFKAKIMQIKNVNEVIVRLISDIPITVCIPLRLCTTNKKNVLYLEEDIFREKREYRKIHFQEKREKVKT